MWKLNPKTLKIISLRLFKNAVEGFIVYIANKLLNNLYYISSNQLMRIDIA